MASENAAFNRDNPNPEREFEIGRDEQWSANLKRLFDEFLQESLTDIRDKRVHFDRKISNSEDSDKSKENIALQALQNAVETANMVSKQAVRHGDLAIDRQWNMDEVSAYVSSYGVNKDAFIAILATLVAEKLKGSN